MLESKRVTVHMSQGSNIGKGVVTSVSIHRQVRRSQAEWVITWLETYERERELSYRWSRWYKQGHVIRKRYLRCYIHPLFRWIVYLSQDLVVDDDDSGVQSWLRLQLQCCISRLVHNDGGYSACHKGGVCLSAVGAVYEVIHIGITSVLWAD